MKDIDPKLQNEILEMFKGLPTIEDTIESTRFHLLNDQLSSATEGTALAVLEARTSTSRKKESRHPELIARIAFGYVNPESQTKLRFVDEHLFIPIQPHLHWRNALADPNDFKVEETPFLAILRGKNVLDDSAPQKVLNHFHYHPDRKITRLTVATGDDAFKFMTELSYALEISIDPISDYAQLLHGNK